MLRGNPGIAERFASGPQCLRQLETKAVVTLWRSVRMRAFAHDETDAESSGRPVLAGRPEDLKPGTDWR